MVLEEAANPLYEDDFGSSELHPLVMQENANANSDKNQSNKNQSSASDITDIDINDIDLTFGLFDSLPGLK